MADSNPDSIIHGLIQGVGTTAFIDSIIHSFVYFAFLSQLVAFCTTRARFASLRFASPEDNIVIKASRTYEPTEGGRNINTTENAEEDEPTGSAEKETEPKTAIKDKGISEVPTADEQPPKDVAAFAKVMESVMLITPNPFPRLVESDVDRWERIHRHLTENNVTFAMLLVALYFALIRCQKVHIEEDGTCKECDVIAFKAAATVYSYISTRAIHFVIYAYAIRQPYRAISFVASQVYLGLFIYLIYKAAY